MACNDDNDNLNFSYDYLASVATNLPHTHDLLSSPMSHAILDSGCSGHYIPPGFPLNDINPTQIGLQVTLPDSTKISSTHTATLPIPTLPPSATTAHVFPHLHSALM